MEDIRNLLAEGSIQGPLQQLQERVPLDFPNLAPSLILIKDRFVHLETQINFEDL